MEQYLLNSLPHNLVENIFYILVAGFLSSMVGLERGLHGRAAGLRTNAMVGIGAALFMIISKELSISIASQYPHIKSIPDPGRIGAQVVSGIGFLGAGAILKSGLSVKGLTTAACLWLVSGIGMACGAGQVILATLVTIFSIACLVLMSLLEKVLPKHSYRTLSLTLPSSADYLMVFTLLKQESLSIKSSNYSCDFVNDQILLTIHVRSFHLGLTDKLFSNLHKKLLSTMPDIKTIKWIRDAD